MKTEKIATRFVPIVIAVLFIAALVGGMTVSDRGSRFAPLAPGGSAVPAGGSGGQGPAAGKPVVANAIHHDLSAPLRSIKPGPNAQGGEDPDLEKEHQIASHGRPGGPAAIDPVRQGTPPTANVAGPTTSFEGTNNINGVLPPDTNGDIGPNHYVQWVNLSFAIYNRSGGLLYGPAAGNTLWSGFGGICQTNNNGDPIVQYDHLADRWMMSQFAFGNGSNYHQCIAVSQSGDPTGAWYRYDFLISATKMNDYPHFGVWPDGYYMSVNQFLNGQSWAGQGVVVFERDQMLAGQAARMIYFDLQSTDPNLGAMLPSDLDGPAPPSGAANVFIEADDDAWGYSPDQLQMWSFATNWGAGTATFTKVGTLPVAAFDSTVSGVSQPGTSVRLASLADRLMYRLQYRNFGGYQTLVLNHSVDVDGLNLAGIRWYELRNSGSGWSIRQQSTFSPDGTSRWMASAAMNGNGDIGLGYSASSGTLYPSIRYAGRLAADPLNQITQGEGILMSGSGSQTHSAARWGDYSMLAVDPVDDCTFWFTSEYLAVTSSASWRTRIGSFQLPGCGVPVQVGTISGTVRDGNTLVALSGATVAVTGGGSTTTDANGAYTLSNLTVGTYQLTASKTGYASSTASGVMVTDGQTTTQNFLLTPQPIVSTGFRAPTANAAVTKQAGDNNGYQTSPGSGYLADGVFALDPNSGNGTSTSCTSPRKDKHLFSSFGFNVPSPAVIKGIEVKLVGHAASTTGTPRFCVQVSRDGGATWTTAKQSLGLTATNTTYTFGTPSDLWGLSGWTAAQLGASFRVRIIDVASVTSQTFYLDGVSVQATYQ